MMRLDDSTTTQTFLQFATLAVKDLHKQEVSVAGVDVTEGEGGIKVTSLSFGTGGGRMVLPGKLSDKIVDSLEVKVEEVGSGDGDSLVSYRIVIHRAENEVNKAMGSGSGKPSTAPHMSIYPLLNQIYEEVGSVEVELNWGEPKGWMSKAKVSVATRKARRMASFTIQPSHDSLRSPARSLQIDSIIHQTKGDVSKVTSFSIDDVANDNPIKRVRESMEKNRSWMSEINESLGKLERPSR